MAEEKKRKVKEIGSKMGGKKARKWVKKYQDKHTDPKHLQGYLFGRDIIEEICQTEGADGIWVFKGINDDGEECFVLFPADEGGNVLDRKIKSIGAAARDDEAANSGMPCPPNCPNFFP